MRLIWILSQRGSATLLLVLLLGCATGTVYQNAGPVLPEDDFALMALREAEQRAFDRVDQLTRRPASPLAVQTELAADLGTKIKGFEVWVFPKATRIERKDRLPLSKALQNPIGFKFSSPIWMPCHQIKAFSHAGYEHQKIFDQTYEAGDRCGVVVIKRSAHGTTESYSLKPQNFAIGDMVEMRLYLDSQYRGHALEILMFTGERVSSRKELVKKLDRRMLRLDPLAPVSSGLTLFPVDLPSFAWSQKPDPAMAGDFERLMDAERTVMIRSEVAAPDDKKINDLIGGSKGPKRFVACGVDRGFQFKYQDLYGNRNSVGWCKGEFWPSVIDNNRFIAIRKSL